MTQKTLNALIAVCLIIAAVGAFTLMLKNPDDNFLSIPTLIFIMVAIALSQIKPKK